MKMNTSSFVRQRSESVTIVTSVDIFTLQIVTDLPLMSALCHSLSEVPTLSTRLFSRSH